MGDATPWARLRCRWSGHTDHVVFKQTGHIYCGRCQAVCPPGTNLRGDVKIHLSAIDAMRGAVPDRPVDTADRALRPKSESPS